MYRFVTYVVVRPLHSSDDVALRPNARHAGIVIVGPESADLFLSFSLALLTLFSLDRDSNLSRISSALRQSMASIVADHDTIALYSRMLVWLPSLEL